MSIPRPDLVVLDVNETLSDLAPLADAFGDVGLDPGDVEAWFAGVLRDAFALGMLGDNPSFAEIGGALLRARLTAAGHPDPSEGAQQVLGRFVALSPHPDVVPGLLALAELGCRIVTLSNGSADVARALLADTAAGKVVEDYLAVAEADAWKPDARAYAHALAAAGVAAERAVLVAVHPWDVEGARRAGLQTAWVNRTGAVYPDHFGPADREVASVVDLAAVLGELPR
ncbi:haloacid dehalogenase type II [Isoptericola sediminis]|uniref:Haloacid dehalogenase type II n=1 Tax=Isoptericola sediminis TaxID=2733572 RepID=A0A849KB92_9MICO|nr:haloacid dehalogenase type II [Isoptericola sediminis]NNU28507.1 haloacid dehalogenase type II [Isoptericola sediminis]